MAARSAPPLRIAAQVFVLVMLVSFRSASAQKEGDLLWKFERPGLGLTYSPAIASDSSILVGPGIVNSDGTLRWFNDRMSGFPSVAAAPDGAVYVEPDQLLSLTLSGNTNWVFPNSALMGPAPALAADGTIIIGNFFGQLIALTPGGMPRWEFSSAAKQFTYPTITPDGSILALGGYEVIRTDTLSFSNHLFSVSSDGNQQWELDLGSSPYGYASAPTIDRDGNIFIGIDNKLLALERSGRKRWEFQTPFRAGPPTLGTDGTVYFGSDFNLYALTPNGSLKWFFPTGDAVESAPTVAADGTIYFGSWDRKLYALNSNGTKKWDFEAEWGIPGSPLLGPNGDVYVTSVSSLYVLKGSSPLASSPWPIFRADPQRTGRAFQIGFEKLERPSTGILRLSLAAELNTNYIIESSTDMRNWFTFTTLQRTDTRPFYVDVQTTVADRKFFRLRLPDR